MFPKLRPTLTPAEKLMITKRLWNSISNLTAHIESRKWSRSYESVKKQYEPRIQELKDLIRKVESL